MNQQRKMQKDDGIMLYDFKSFKVQSEFLVPIQGLLIDVNDWETSKDVSGC